MCIDPFEEVFEVSQKQVEGLELTDILDPIMFENHRDIVNALFEVYYDLSQQYLKTHGDDKKNTLYEDAQDKLRLRYGLEKK